jgi:hypothetical protein
VVLEALAHGFLQLLCGLAMGYVVLKYRLFGVDKASQSKLGCKLNRLQNSRKKNRAAAWSVLCFLAWNFLTWLLANPKGHEE